MGSRIGLRSTWLDDRKVLEYEGLVVKDIRLRSNARNQLSWAGTQDGVDRLCW